MSYRRRGEQSSSPDRDFATREELGEFRDRVLDAIESLGRKVEGRLAEHDRRLEEQAKRSQWTLPQIGMGFIALCACFGAPFTMAMQTRYMAEETARAHAEHLHASERKAERLEDADFKLEEHDSEIRQRLRGAEERLAEGEEQHEAIGEELRLVIDYERRMRDAYCTSCDRAGVVSRLHFDPPTAHALTEIGGLEDPD